MGTRNGIGMANAVTVPSALCTAGGMDIGMAMGVDPGTDSVGAGRSTGAGSCRGAGAGTCMAIGVGIAVCLMVPLAGVMDLGVGCMSADPEKDTEAEPGTETGASEDAGAGTGTGIGVGAGIDV
mmetsp:Transcript_72422/g.120718  ORF Transcript_72422/g.120718 Transcript_72422/m.120718 type:complete len:124 (+) Transcript_72422:400-771(+)|eukprot:CAMPEP_0119305920 /NCGR_PEP_ID=MMETSP1333-20130426/6799_1 /TAXON_ID=418940 /ORGANISM="Scyphosphaera apsteinii, Strain RCC1455" /LENGTH=123 /DNA_ID=CAMNT_0007309113 /DNA_START=327 /DNA_END=698 /DNA_ORIENTATION=-